jgi:predicted kinase
LLAPAVPMVVCTGGLSGTGKSVLARSLAPCLRPIPGALLFRSDVERKVLFDVAETDHLTPEAYQPAVSEEIYRILNDKAVRVARAGPSVIVDAVFAKPEERSAIEAAIADVGVRFRGLFLLADLQTRLKRIVTRQPDASDADVGVVRKQEEILIGSIAWSVIDASGSPVATLAKARAILD